MQGEVDGPTLGPSVSILLPESWTWRPERGSNVNQRAPVTGLFGGHGMVNGT